MSKKQGREETERHHDKDPTQPATPSPTPASTSPDDRPEGKSWHCRACREQHDIDAASLYKEALAIKNNESSYLCEMTGYSVFTSKFLREKTGACCGFACRHCPFDHVNVKASMKWEEGRGSSRESRESRDSSSGSSNLSDKSRTRKKMNKLAKRFQRSTAGNNNNQSLEW